MIVGSWRCLVGPKGMPADRIAFLESNLLAVLKDPDFQAKAKAGRLHRRPGRRQGDGGALEIGRYGALSDPARGGSGQGAAEIERGDGRHEVSGDEPSLRSVLP